jgi:hypothetical protein
VSALAPKPVLITKDEDWTEHLFKQVRGVMHTRRISRKLSRVVVPVFEGTGLSNPVIESTAAYRSPRDRGSLPHADATHEVADLVQDIEDHWQYLDPKLKDRIRRYFHVETNGTRVNVSLF